VNVIHEHIAHPESSYRLLHLELDAFGGGRHRHRQFELTWIESGTGLRFVGDSVQPYEAGDLVILGPDLPHAWLSAPGEPGQRCQAATVLQFPPELLSPVHLPEMAGMQDVIDAARRGLRVEGSGQADVTGALRRARGAHGLAGLAAVLDVLACLARHRASMTPLASAASGVHAAGSAEHDRRIARVIDWVHHNLAQELTVDHAARLVHISPAAFSRFFSREVGRSFTTYINDLRCSEASLMLRATGKPVAVIAQECGFATLSNFNRQFKLRQGSTPRSLRRPRPG
jgi:AraC-like DNA-binding protein